MDNVYRTQIAELINTAYPQLATTHRLEFRNVFGAIGGYVNGRIFASYGKFGFALRLPPDILLPLFNEKAATHLKYFPKGHVKKEYGVLHKLILGDTTRLRALLKKSIQYTLK